MRLLALLITSLVLSFVPLCKEALAQPNPDEYRSWCHEQESRISAHFSVPSDLTSKQLGPLRAVISFHLLPSGQVKDFKTVRSSRAEKAIITIPEKDFAAIEHAMIDAVRKSAPLPLPKTEPGTKGINTVKYIFEPSGTSPTTILLVAQ